MRLNIADSINVHIASAPTRIDVGRKKNRVPWTILRILTRESPY
jgi:hypothetical protein